MAETIKQSIQKNLKEIESEDPRYLIDRRYEKFRCMGAYAAPEVKTREKKIPAKQ